MVQASEDTDSKQHQAEEEATVEHSKMDVADLEKEALTSGTAHTEDLNGGVEPGSALENSTTAASGVPPVLQVLVQVPE